METKTLKNNKETKTSQVGKKVLSGVVASTKMKDTVVVEVTRFVKHAKYGKYFKSTKRFKAHDAGNTKAMGDKVMIEECAPISKDKRFRVI